MCFCSGVSKSVPLGWLVHSAAIRGKSKFPKVKVKRHGATILLFAFKTEGI